MERIRTLDNIDNGALFLVFYESPFITGLELVIDSGAMAQYLRPPVQKDSRIAYPSRPFVCGGGLEEFKIR